jgi:hypothetical protein
MSGLITSPALREAALCVTERWLTDFRNGSTALVERSRHVGFTPDSGHVAAAQRTNASGH